MSYRIAVDTGGTFSDVVVADAAGGELWVSKAPTTPDRVFDGISEALAYGASEHGLTFEQLLDQTSVFIYGTTRATNAILTGSTARTALLTTEGHPDTLVLREGGKLNPFDFRHQYPEPYIPRRLTFEIPERVNSEGEVVRRARRGRRAERRSTGWPSSTSRRWPCACCGRSSTRCTRSGSAS